LAGYISGINFGKNLEDQKAMLFKLRIKSDKEEKFVMHIDADATNTFFQLHESIQEVCKYDPLQLVTFFLADEEWDKGLEIKMFASTSGHPDSSDSWIMKKTNLGDLIKETEDKFIYVFDVFNQKSLYIELNEIDMGKTINAPVITLSKGIAPVQTFVNSYDNNLLLESDPDLQNVFNDLGELEDLNEIYGEMSNII